LALLPLVSAWYRQTQTSGPRFLFRFSNQPN
jgi:hypothetical protein